MRNPERIGPYRVIGELARGGQGVVYEAEGPQGKAAVKLLLDPDPDAVRRFRREAGVLERLEHPNLLRSLGSGESEGLPYLALELVEGRDLARQVREDGPPPHDWLARTLALAARALHHCHEHGIVHRDFKPANVQIEAATGRPVVIDFGLIKRDLAVFGKLSEGSVSRLTHSGELLGTPAYMAPEQVDPKFGEVDRRADVYALGASLYHCLTGTPPFLAAATFNILLNVMEEPPPDPRELMPGVPASLAKLCMRAMSKAQGSRPGDAEEFARLLEAAASTPRRRSPLRLGGLIGLLLVGLAAAALLSTSSAPLEAARRHLERGEWEQARAAAQERVAAGSVDERVDAILIGAEALIWSADMDRATVEAQALAEIDQALALAPGNPRALGLRAYARLDAVDGQFRRYSGRHPEELRQDAEAALRADPSEPSACLVLGLLDFKRAQGPEKLERAERRLRACLDAGRVRGARLAELLTTRAILEGFARAHPQAAASARRGAEAFPKTPGFARQVAAAWALAAFMEEARSPGSAAVVECLDRALQALPGYGPAYYLRADLKLARGDRAGSLDDLRLAMDGVGPRSEFHLTYVARMLEGSPSRQELRSCLDALSAAEGLLPAEGDRAPLLELRLRVLRGLGPQAEVDASLTRAQHHLAVGEWTEAREAAEAAAAKGEGEQRVDALLLGVEALVWSADMDRATVEAQALAEIDQALALAPGDARALGLRAYVRLEALDGYFRTYAGEHADQLRGDAEAALASDPSEPAACLALVLLDHLRLKHLGGAQRLELFDLCQERIQRPLQEGRVSGARLGELLMCRGLLEVAGGKTDAAIASMQRGVESFPLQPGFDRQRAGALVLLGYVEQTAGRLEAAGARYEACLQVVPDHAPAHFNRAALKVLRGDHQGGLDDLRRSLTGVGPLSDFHLTYVQRVLAESPSREVLLECLGFLDQAEALRQAGKGFASEGRLLLERARVLARLGPGRREEARSLLLRAREAEERAPGLDPRLVRDGVEALLSELER